MNYVDIDASIHNLNREEKHEYYKLSHRLVYKEEFDWTKLKPGDVCVYFGARFLIDRFFYQDEEYFVWDYASPRGWYSGVESMIHDVVPQGAQLLGTEIYDKKMKDLWKALTEERDLKLKAKEQEVKDGQ